MLTDNRKEFENALFRKLCSGLDILKLHTTCNQSRSNGCVERWYRSLNAMMGKVVQTHQTDWPSHVPFVVNAYNTMTHSSTNYTPFFLTFGREQQHGPAVEHRSLAGVLSLSCARLVADG